MSKENKFVKFVYWINKNILEIVFPLIIYTLSTIYSASLK